MLKRIVSIIMLTLLLVGYANFVVSSFPSFYLVHGADVVCEIDLFSQRGGIGKNASSPPFETGERIILFAYVTCDQTPVQHMLVAFQVNNPEDSPILVSTAQTNSSGYATINFTTAQEMYPIYPSLWKAYATSSPSQETVQDTMPFYMLSSADPPIIVPDDYPTIQEAINHTNEGDTIFVRNGTYSGPIVVDKTLILEGENRNATIIDGGTNEPYGSVVLVTADNVKISGFTIQHCRAGGNAIWLDYYVNMTFSDNIITGCNEGVRILHSSGNVISHNIVQDCYYNTGVGFDWAFNNTVRQNTIINNHYGLSGGYDNHNNTYSENTIINNDIGFGTNMYDDKFFHNNFVNNDVHVIASGINQFDDGYPSGGNFWSDYTGVDANGDGIGDTPYVIDGSNQDNYPLMNPWTAPDVAVTNIALSKTVVGQGFPVLMNVTLANQGNKIEGFNVTVYANEIAIQTQYVVLTAGNYTSVIFTWDTAGFAYGYYVVSANATALEGEVNTLDNTLAFPEAVQVTILGDVNGDGIINIKDATIIGLNWLRGGSPPPIIILNADINGDGIVNIKDATIIGLNWLQHA